MHLINSLPSTRAPTIKADSKAPEHANHLLSDAWQRKASDIHLDRLKDHAAIRYRIDGQLNQPKRLDTLLAKRIIAQIKVRSGLDISKHQAVQEGAMTFHVPNRDSEAVPCRVSICPTVWGERMALRLLDTESQLPKLDALGWLPEQANCLKKKLIQKQGLWLVTGPTGSGKTTTLYALLKSLASASMHIISVEDPIEITIEGVNQMPAKRAHAGGFASVMPILLRQDPDVIMMGETRDLTTYESVLSAAQSGHFTLTSLHSKSALETFTRLTHMGADPYFLAETCEMIIAQRLIRRLCPHCKIKQRLPASLTKQASMTCTHYTPRGCSACIDGYWGRLALFEVLPMDAPIAKALQAHHDRAICYKVAKAHGFIDFHAAAWHHVMAGNTSLAEIQPWISDTKGPILDYGGH